MPLVTIILIYLTCVKVRNIKTHGLNIISVEILNYLFFNISRNTILIKLPETPRECLHSIHITGKCLSITTNSSLSTVFKNKFYIKIYPKSKLVIQRKKLLTLEYFCRQSM